MNRWIDRGGVLFPEQQLRDPLAEAVWRWAVRNLHIWTPDEEAYLLEHYRSMSDAPAIAEHLGLTKKQVETKAYRLGIRLAPDAPHWGEAELEYLEAWAELEPFPALVSRFQRKARQSGWAERTPRAIQAKLSELNYSTRPQVGWLTVPILTAGLGYQSRYRIDRWIQQKKLKASGGRSQRDPYLIRDTDFVNFALTYPAEVSEGLSPEGACWLLQTIRDSKTSSSIRRSAHAS